MFYSFPSSKRDQKVAASGRGCSGLECCQALRHQPEPLLLLLLRSLLPSIPPLGLVFVLLVVRQNPPVPLPRSPGSGGGLGGGGCEPSPFPTRCSGRCRAERWLLLPSCVPPFLPLPITRYVFFFFALLSLAFIYPLKPWLSPPLPPLEYFVSAPVSRERPSARPPSPLVTWFINRQYFPSSFVVRILCSAALSCLPASQRNR